ncbi:CLUMA_CG016897, isoform A [Clunio marinus]|uniref:CLUMA_CG016897, isoform A n=1 Tax=Clunio marinus TaxID=568069 RepID=A0A1J1IU95_9DIPT|nr:CLUMA_CG016897, isoform A [Clunio marinus]
MRDTGKRLEFYFTREFSTKNNHRNENMMHGNLKTAGEKVERKHFKVERKHFLYNAQHVKGFNVSNLLREAKTQY